MREDCRPEDSLPQHSDKICLCEQNKISGASPLDSRYRSGSHNSKK